MNLFRYLVVCLGTLQIISAEDGSASAQESRPNIVFIMADDQGPWALGASGDPNAITPRLDRLRTEGVMLTHCYAATPVCSPSRASLLTSRYGSELGIADFLQEKSTESLDPKLPTWPRALADAGYTTGLVGKYHCGNKPESHPTKIGYAEFAGFVGSGQSSQDPTLEIDGKLQIVPGWTSDILADRAMDFIRRHKRSRFALSMHFWAPHANHVESKERTWLPLSEADWNPFKSLDPKLPEPDYPKLDAPLTQRMLREYLGSVHSVDRNVGRLLDLLDELKLTDHTLVIFTSDHGYSVGQHGIWHKGNGRWLLTDNQGDRPNMWDDSLRVPALVRWPGMIRPGSTVSQTVSHLDWHPTLAAIAGATVPKDVVMRGGNILPLLKGEQLDRSSDFYAQYNMRGGSNMRSYQTEQWKLIRYLDRKLPDEFYNRTADPRERQNLAASNDPAIQNAIAELDEKLRARMHEIGDLGAQQGSAKATPKAKR